MGAIKWVKRLTSYRNQETLRRANNNRYKTGPEKKEKKEEKKGGENGSGS